MKKFWLTILTAVLFLGFWVVGTILIPIPSSWTGVYWRLAAEAIPFLLVIVLTALFRLIPAYRFPLCLFPHRPGFEFSLGLGTGALWIGAALAVPFSLGCLRLRDFRPDLSLFLWALAALINVIMQELLFRGFLYRLFKYRLNTAAAVIITSVLFTLVHGTEAGWLGVVNVFTMSLAMAAALEFSGSLIVPVCMHALWNILGGIVFGCVPLAADYPSLFGTTFSGNVFLSGGTSGPEASLVTFFLNLVIIAVFWIPVLIRGTKHTKKGRGSRRKGR